MQRDTRLLSIFCIDCQTKLQCAACLVAYDKTSWSVKERHNHITKDYKLVCKSCREKGCHPQDTQMYTCQKCKQQLGAKNFYSTILKNYNSRGTTKVQCNQCASEEANLLKELHLKLKKKHQTLQMLLSSSQRKVPVGSLLSW